MKFHKITAKAEKLSRVAIIWATEVGIEVGILLSLHIFNRGDEIENDQIITSELERGHM